MRTTPVNSQVKVKETHSPYLFHLHFTTTTELVSERKNSISDEFLLGIWENWRFPRTQFALGCASKDLLRHELKKKWLSQQHVFDD